MKSLYTLLLLGLLGPTASAQSKKPPAAHLIAATRELHNPSSNQVLVIAHRGDWRNAPENSLQAVRNCIALGVDMVEIDVKKTKDGQLIILHDSTLDRTTTGRGRPEDFTLAEIKQLYLRNGTGHPTRHRVPTFEEVMRAAKNQILVNVDQGYDYFKEVYATLVATGTLQQALLKNDRPVGQVKAENGDLLPKVMFMPVVNLSKADARKIIADYQAAIHPAAFEMIFAQDSAALIKSDFRAVRAKGTKVWVNSLWPALCGGHDDDVAVEEQRPQAAWGWLLARGVTMIQTDRPALLLDYLRARQLHK